MDEPEVTALVLPEASNVEVLNWLDRLADDVAQLTQIA